VEDKIIDNVLKQIGFEFTRFIPNAVTEELVWDCPTLRLRVAETFLENYVVTLSGEDFIASTPVDAARIIVLWYDGLKKDGKFAVKEEPDDSGRQGHHRC
jgi:hypothetical protein